MAEERVQRKLTTILAADVAGYARLMRADEEATLRTLGEYREIIDGSVTRHDGRVFGTGGDSVLAEFGSAVEAVRCAVEIQEELAARNGSRPEDRRMWFRIGINVGDVMVRDGELFGDGVNLAARLEGEAEPGGIWVSGSAHDHVRGKLSFRFEDMGPRQLKNIAEPVPAFRLAHGSAPETSRGAGRWRMPALAAVAVALLLAGGAAWWQPWAPNAGMPQHQPPAPADKPSVAVLPFTNMSEAAEQEYFSDGMTEDLITDLSKISALTVISGASTSEYKGQAPDLRDVASELNVRYVVQGSVRRAGAQVRITAQLVVAETGEYLWAERYDRDYTDIFALQDEVRAKIVSALAVTLTPDEERRLARALTANPQAYDLYLKALQQESYFTREGNLESRRLYLQAIELDPDFAAAHAHLAQAYSLAIENSWAGDPGELKNKAVETALRATALDDELPYAYWSLGRIYSRPYIADPERAKIAFKRAVFLNPNYADGYMFLALMHIFTGEAEKAFGLIDKAMRFNPRYPFWYLQSLGMAQFFVGDYEASIEALERGVERNPNVPWLRTYLIASYGQMGQIDDAEWQASEVEALGLPATIRDFMEITPIQDPAYRKLYEDALRKSGLPEG